MQGFSLSCVVNYEEDIHVLNIYFLGAHLGARKETIVPALRSLHLTQTPGSFSALISYSCSNKAPQIGWLKQKKCYFLTVLDVSNPRSRSWQGWLPLSHLISFCVFTRRSLCVSVCPNFPFL